MRTLITYIWPLLFKILNKKLYYWVIFVVTILLNTGQWRTFTSREWLEVIRELGCAKILAVPKLFIADSKWLLFIRHSLCKVHFYFFYYSHYDPNDFIFTFLLLTLWSKWFHFYFFSTHIMIPNDLIFMSKPVNNYRKMNFFLYISVDRAHEKHQLIVHPKWIDWFQSQLYTRFFIHLFLTHTILIILMMMMMILSWSNNSVVTRLLPIT